MRAEMYALHEEHEATHWWFVARRRIVLRMLRAELPADHPPLRLLDVGCGAGGMLAYLREFGDVVGVDPSPDAVAWSARKGATDVRLGTLPDGLPFADSERFDVITLLDVLEHVEEDRAALASLHRLLVPGGLIVITVPAFQFLWSGHDVVNEHKRRYTRPQLLERLVTAGFEVHNLSYFNTALFPPIAGVRILKRMLGADEGKGDLGVVPGPLNRMLGAVFGAERHVLPHMRLPFGVSLIATAVSATNRE